MWSDEDIQAELMSMLKLLTASLDDGMYPNPSTRLYAKANAKSVMGVMLGGEDNLYEHLEDVHNFATTLYMHAVFLNIHMATEV